MGLLALVAGVHDALVVLLHARLRRLAETALGVRLAPEVRARACAAGARVHRLGHFRLAAALAHHLVQAPLVGALLGLQARVAAVDEQRTFAIGLAVVSDRLCHTHEILLALVPAAAGVVALAGHQLRLLVHLAEGRLDLLRQVLPPLHQFALTLDGVGLRVRLPGDVALRGALMREGDGRGRGRAIGVAERHLRRRRRRRLRRRLLREREAGLNAVDLPFPHLLGAAAVVRHGAVVQRVALGAVHLPVAAVGVRPTTLVVVLVSSVAGLGDRVRVELRDERFVIELELLEQVRLPGAQAHGGGSRAPGGGRGMGDDAAEHEAGATQSCGRGGGGHGAALRPWRDGRPIVILAGGAAGGLVGLGRRQSHSCHRHGADAW
mmetsp:Transcript_95139/g.273941  ORF Transcript_95139/g.273941 Transcript_95139/m.273941 type:complete len:379 (-) Transcript_95139:28-1164(-)